MSDDIRSKLDWVDRSPRGEDLPISCTYDFSFGKPMPDDGDLPEGFERVLLACNDEEAAEAGFRCGQIFLAEVDGEMKASHDPEWHPDARPIHYSFLRDQNGDLVATWDEGRWWTPDESAAWGLMLASPAAYQLAEANRMTKLPRWMRRKLDK
jgi:hypothetical protein